MSHVEAREPAKFSVVIPCYNDGRFLSRSVDSIIAQTYPHWELIVVDDGSTDDTPQICAQLEDQLRGRFKYVRQDNAGVSAARNTGLEAAACDYVVFLDSDDELDRQCLEHYANALQAAPGALWLIGNSQWERSQKLKVRHLRIGDDRHQRFSQLLQKKLHLGNISNMCFARDILRRISFPENMRFGEDTVVFAILLATTDPVLIPEVTALAHRRPDSLRSRASLVDLIESPQYETLFGHPMLPPEFRRHERTLRARHCVSIAKRAYREGAYAVAFERLSAAVKNRPLMMLNPKVLLRIVVSWMRRRRESPA